MLLIMINFICKHALPISWSGGGIISTSTSTSTSTGTRVLAKLKTTQSEDD